MEETTESIPADWPQSMIDLAMVVGVEITERLMVEFAGRRFYVPKRIKDGHWLAVLLGQEGAEKLSDNYGGDQLVLSMGTKVKRRRRDQAIIRQYDSGWSVDELALEHDLTARQIFNVLKKTV